MTTNKDPSLKDILGEDVKELFVVLCTSGFDRIANARSALMFASLAAAANYRTIVFCIQNAVDMLVEGAIEKNEKPQAGVPTLAQRLEEALEMGIEIQSCTQTMNNKKISEADLIPGVQARGAMNLINLAAHAKGTLCF